ncbi:MAG TPA: tagaturonate reductase [Cyclobacteriaceae bacterium]|nr:tagaturonate reductase [Cyclobacteriaceae bacterium]
MTSLKLLNRSTVSDKIPTRPIKVLQFGSGNFLRGFADWIIDVMNEKADFNGSVQIIQSVSQDNALNEQQGLYHVVVNGLKNNKRFNETRLVTCVIGAMSPDKNITAFLKLAENPDLEFIISNTTEAGIIVNDKDASVQELSSTFPGKLTQLLHHRFQFFSGTKPLIIIPCELIADNGEELKKAILQYANLWKLPAGFTEWIHQNIFCNTLVDRIVPGAPKENLQEIKQRIGFDDKLIVTAEPFHLWVIEGPEIVRQKFPADQAGLDVKFVKDHNPYRIRKVRILNGAHTALVPVAYLFGLRTVKESIENDFIGPFIKKVIYEEIIPTLDLPKEELKQFADDTIERFLNPYIRHELITIALNSVSKFKYRVVPTILEYYKRTNQLPKNLLLSLAALMLFYKGEWKGAIIKLNDTPEVLSYFKKAWGQNKTDEIIDNVLSNPSFWDTDLTRIAGLTDAVKNGMNYLVGRDFGK